MKKKGEKIMPTKELTKEEIFPANNFRTISQKSLIEKAKQVEKLGIFSNNDLSLVLMDWGKYESIIDLVEEKQKLVEEQQKQIERYESMLEDLSLAKDLEQRVLDVEEGRTKTYKVNDANDIMKLLENRG
ncbi:hypothetical protein AAGG74_15695 [Bacillus mexicanus]|uniref:hypothetical protein n=1 Tax=Bacillus mexicanus TaxID=2834415 RepID=UPI003D200549